eukprot:683249-Ditylum_brightwellii.AAC.1
MINCVINKEDYDSNICKESVDHIVYYNRRSNIKLKIITKEDNAFHCVKNTTNDAQRRQECNCQCPNYESKEKENVH